MSRRHPPRPDGIDRQIAGHNHCEVARGIAQFFLERGHNHAEIFAAQIEPGVDAPGQRKNPVSPETFGCGIVGAHEVDLYMTQRDDT